MGVIKSCCCALWRMNRIKLYMMSGKWILYDHRIRCRSKATSLRIGVAGYNVQFRLYLNATGRDRKHYQKYGTRWRRSDGHAHFDQIWRPNITINSMGVDQNIKF